MRHKKQGCPNRGVNINIRAFQNAHSCRLILNLWKPWRWNWKEIPSTPMLFLLLLKGSFILLFLPILTHSLPLRSTAKNFFLALIESEISKLSKKKNVGRRSLNNFALCFEIWKVGVWRAISKLHYLFFSRLFQTNFVIFTSSLRAEWRGKCWLCFPKCLAFVIQNFATSTLPGFLSQFYSFGGVTGHSHTKTLNSARRLRN